MSWAAWTGRWVNTNPDTTGIAAFEVATSPTPTLRLIGAGGEETTDWGATEASLYTCVEEAGVPSSALFATYERGAQRTQIQLRMNKGIAPLMTWNDFSDAQGSYFHREFFRRADGNA